MVYDLALELNDIALPLPLTCLFSLELISGYRVDLSISRYPLAYLACPVVFAKLLTIRINPHHAYTLIAKDRSLT